MLQRLLSPNLSLQKPKPAERKTSTEIVKKPKKIKKLTKEEKEIQEIKHLQETRASGLVRFGVQITLPKPRKMEPQRKPKLEGQVEDHHPCPEDSEHPTECLKASKSEKLFWVCTVCKQQTGTFSGKPKWIGWDGADEEFKPSDRKHMPPPVSSAATPKRAKLESVSETTPQAFAQGQHVSLRDLAQNITSIDLKQDMILERLERLENRFFNSIVIPEQNIIPVDDPNFEKKMKMKY